MMKLVKNFSKGLLFGNHFWGFCNFFPFILFLFSLTACQSDYKKDSTQAKMLHLNGTPVSLHITTQQAVIRKDPSLESPEIARRIKGDSILFTNKITPYNRSIKIEGIHYNEPWLRVILEDNKSGWIYGGCINFRASENLQLKEKVLDQRALTFFGPSLTQQISIYQKKTQTTATLEAFRSLLSMTRILKDSLEEQINLNLQMHRGSTFPDFFWLNELMNGMLVHYIPEHHKYYLFKDLKYWQKISQKTLEPEDNAFIELLLAAYPSDSIEYVYYGWQLPVDSTTTCSLLGSDIHSNVLEKMVLVLDSNSYFQSEIRELKQALVDDISINKHYWFPLESIQEELASIIDQNYLCLEKYDWIAIRSQRQLLNDHENNNIEINLFDGR